MLNEQYRVGRFGDAHLDKGGRNCSKALLCVQVRVYGVPLKESGPK